MFGGVIYVSYCVSCYGSLGEGSVMVFCLVGFVEGVFLFDLCFGVVCILEFVIVVDVVVFVVVNMFVDVFGLFSVDEYWVVFVFVFFVNGIVFEEFFIFELVVELIILC